MLKASCALFLTSVTLCILLLSCTGKNKKHEGFSAHLEILQTVDSTVISRALLVLQTDHHFAYNEKDLEIGTNLFSTGTWYIKQDTIILKTDPIEDCYYVKKSLSFQCDNLNNMDPGIVIKPYSKPLTTVTDCVPETFATAYADLTDEKFVIKKDYLIYIKRENDCSKYFHDIKLSIKRKL